MKIPIEVKFLRIIPKTWKNRIALKVKLFGCTVYRVPGTVKNNNVRLIAVCKHSFFVFNINYNLSKYMVIYANIMLIYANIC